MLHEHSVGAIDEILIGDYPADGAGSVEAVSGGIPIEISNGVESAGCFRTVDDALACGFFETHEAVLSPKFDKISCLGFLVSVKLVGGNVSAAYVLFLVGIDLCYVIGSGTVLFGLSFE